MRSHAAAEPAPAGGAYPRRGYGRHAHAACASGSGGRGVQAEGQRGGACGGDAVEYAGGVQQGHRTRAHQGREDVQVLVPAEQGRYLDGEDATQDTATHGAGHAECHGGGQAEAVAERLYRSGGAESARAAVSPTSNTLKSP
jgi:hypothetical protein